MSFRLVIVLVAVATALGFSPSTRSAGSKVRALSMNAMSELPGALAPLGFFDPLGLSKNLDEVEISRFRECELVSNKSFRK